MIARRLWQKSVVVCVGPTAAAIALAAAYSGRRAAVITVDPAPRLRDALGLREGGGPHRVELGRAVGVLDAYALEPKRTFDAIVERLAPSTEAAQRILENRLYRELSAGLSGSADYVAIAKVYDLIDPPRYQTVVVDTPPSAHVEDLLSAPHRLGTLLASRAFGLLQAPGSVLAGATSFTRMMLGALLSALERWTGIDLLAEIAEFTQAVKDVAPRFGERAERMAAVLRAPSTAFVLVVAPEPAVVESAIDFYGELAAGGFPVAGVVANRVLSFPKWRGSADRYPEPLRGRLVRNYEQLWRLSRRDALALRALGAETGLPLLAAVPLRSEAPASIDQLVEMAAYFGAEGEAVLAVR